MNNEIPINVNLIPFDAACDSFNWGVEALVDLGMILCHLPGERATAPVIHQIVKCRQD